MISRKRNAKPIDEVRASIRHPTLRDAYDHDCFYPWPIPEDDRMGEKVAAAIAGGWSEWIETELDLRAVRQGYVFDQSRDHRLRPIYWHAVEIGDEVHRGWWRYRGNILVRIDETQEPTDKWHIGSGDFACRFIETFLLHTKGDKIGHPIQLVPIHRKNVMTVFGWISLDTGLRRYVSSYWEMAKKQAKTTMIAGIILFLLIADGYVNPATGKFCRENRAEVFGAARDSNQAQNVFDESMEFVRISPYLSDCIEIIGSRYRLTFPETASFYQVLSMDAASADGKDAQAVVLDELHAHRDRKMFAFTDRAGRSRRQPLNMAITTAGENIISIWWEERQRAGRVIASTSREIRHHAAIFSGESFQISLTEPASAGDVVLRVERLLHPVAEGQILRFGGATAEKTQWPLETPAPQLTEATKLEVKVTERAKRFQRFVKVTPVPADIERYATALTNDDWTTDHAIRCANPSIGYTCKMETLQLDRDKALDDHRKVSEYKRFTLSMLSESTSTWVNIHAWNRCAGLEHDWHQLRGKPCFGGLDIAISQDLMAFWLAFPSWPIGTFPTPDMLPRLTLLGMCWLPGERVVERESQEDVQYRHIAERSNFGDFGYCRIHEGAVVNHGKAASDILAMRDLFQIQAVAYDPNLASFVVEPYLVPAGLACISHRQGAVSMSPPTAWFDQFVKKIQLAHGSNPLLDVAAANARLHTPDKVGNTYPAKGKSRGRIDPIVAAVMAVGFCCMTPKGIESVFSAGDSVSL